MSNRKQQVILPGVLSELSTLKAGVLQGSILFLLYINNIVENINCSIRLFADDTSLYIIVDDPLDTAQLLNSDISKVHTCATIWFVTFNPGKFESLLFSRKLYRAYHPPVCMNNQPVAEVASHKHSGLVFCSDCTWHDHFEHIKAKAWAWINVVRKLKFQLDRKSLQIIYFSFNRLLLEYGDEAARIVIGATKLVSISSLLSETGWEPLASRRRKHKLILFF